MLCQVDDLRNRKVLNGFSLRELIIQFCSSNKISRCSITESIQSISIIGLQMEKFEMKRALWFPLAWFQGFMLNLKNKMQFLQQPNIFWKHCMLQIIGDIGQLLFNYTVAFFQLLFDHAIILPWGYKWCFKTSLKCVFYLDEMSEKSSVYFERQMFSVAESSNWKKKNVW